jgi:hypothetical protein
MTTTATTVLATLTATLLAVGCAPADPYTDTTTTPAGGSALADRVGPRARLAQSPGELPGRAPATLTAERGGYPEAQQTPSETLRLAARLYGNWSSSTAAARLERMAKLATGQARVELRQAAAQSRADSQQRGARARASVEAIHVQRAGQRRRGLVVTRELTRVPELPSGGWRYRVTLAAVSHRPKGWVLSRWRPQP